MPIHPTNLVQPEGGQPIETGIVVCVDRSPASADALTAAIELSRRLGAHLDVFHLVSLDDGPIDLDAPDRECSTRDRAQQEGEAVRRRLGESRLPVWSWKHYDWHGDPAAVLISMAEQHGARMIVIGAQPASVLGALREQLEGSVAEEVVRRSSVPVLVIPPAPNR